MDLKGSKTEKNLLAAFAGESQARNRYTYFAGAAKNEGLEQISGIFLETADNEKEHAKVFFKYLQGGSAEITAMYPAGIIGKTANNLFAAAEGEKLECKKNKTVKWHCRNCGYIHEGTEAPKECPACKHGQSYYEVLAENW